MDNKQFLRERMLRNLINEGILHSLAEQDEQQPMVSSTPPSAAAPSPETNQITQPQEPVQPEQPAEFTVDEMIKKMNVIRGGRSFKDAEVYGALTGFFKNLSDEQKKLFEWFLDEISKVVAGGEDSNQPVADATSAPEPTNAQPPAVTPPPAAPAGQGPQAPLTPRQ